jgi:hypothetical protein
MKTTQQPARPVARTWARHFEASSVLLFAALTWGSAGGVHAQSGGTSSPSTPSKTVIGPSSASSGKATFGGSATESPSSSGGAGAGSSGNSASAAAFQRADKDHDGMLSAQEAATLPAIGSRFESLDTNKDKMLSRQEFEAGLKS